MLPGTLGAIRKLFMDHEHSLSTYIRAIDGGREGHWLATERRLKLATANPIGMNLSGAVIKLTEGDM